MVDDDEDVSHLSPELAPKLVPLPRSHAEMAWVHNQATGFWPKGNNASGSSWLFPPARSLKGKLPTVQS